MQLRNYKVRIKCIVSSTSKERLEQELKDILGNDLDVCLEPDTKLEDCIEVYNAN